MGKKFGEYLKQLREDRGWTLRDAEREAKISNAYLSQVERGERGIPNFKVLKRLAEAYGISIQELMEVASKEEKGGKIKTEMGAPDVRFVSRGYEKLSEGKKKTLKSFLQHLTQEDKKERQK